MAHTWKENNVRSGDDNLWDKEADPELEGMLVKIEENVGSHESTLYTIKKDDDTEVKVWGSTVLDDRFLGVQEGTYVKVSYEGLVKGKNGKSYHGYKVFIDEDSLPQEEESGYSKAKKVAQKLGGIEDEEINLEDIPY